MSNLRTFNPIQDAIKDTAGFQGAARRRFRKLICWKCQKEVARNMGKESLPFVKGTHAKGLTTGTAFRKFVCFECVPKKGE